MPAEALREPFPEFDLPVRPSFAPMLARLVDALPSGKLVATPCGQPSITFQGKWWFIGGERKFKGVTGGGTQKGR